MSTITNFSSPVIYIYSMKNKEKLIIFIVNSLTNTQPGDQITKSLRNVDTYVLPHQTVTLYNVQEKKKVPALVLDPGSETINTTFLVL